ncbi:MAG TPA: hypothetical protein VIE66_02305 [Methylocella sp.]|jgi:hypothetical protein
MANRFHLFFGGVARLQNCFSELKQPCSRWRRHHLRVPPLKQFNSDSSFAMLAEIAGCETATRSAPFVNPPASTTTTKCLI